MAFFKSGWGGTHNFKFGYQLNHLFNVISQNGNVPFVSLTVGGWPATRLHHRAAPIALCSSRMGNLHRPVRLLPVVTDFATILPQPAVDWNHAFFVQDSWTIGHGLTLNLGLRMEKENLPVPPGLIPAVSDHTRTSTSRGVTRSSLAWERRGDPRMAS